MLSQNKNEANAKNNQMDFVIEVLDSRSKVLILSDAPHPDIAAISSAINANKNFESDEFHIKNFTGDISNYNLLVFHQLPSVKNAATNILNEAKALEIPILFVIGQNTYLQRLNNITDFRIAFNRNKQFEEIYPHFNSEFTYYTISEDIENLVNSFPPLLCPFANYQNVVGSQILFFQKIRNISTTKPLISFNTTNDQRMAFIFGEGIWRWKMYDYKNNGSDVLFNEFVNKIIQFLSLKVKKERFRIQVKKVFDENQQVKFRAEIYNKNFELISTPEINMQITDEKGNRFPYVFVKTDNYYQLNAGRFKAGNYSYKAETAIAGEKFVKSGNYSVLPVNIEFQQSIADYNLLNQIAVSTGGELINIQNIDELSDKIKANSKIKSSGYIDSNYVELINLKWLFFVILLLISLEWFLRKYYGGI